jgi:hypothetical protein
LARRRPLTARAICNLRKGGEGKRAKARELVALAEREGHLAALETAIRRRRPAFGDQVDQSLYLADQALRDVIRKINDLPRPGSYAARSQ